MNLTGLSDMLVQLSGDLLGMEQKQLTTEEELNAVKSELNATRDVLQTGNVAKSFDLHVWYQTIWQDN